MQYVILAVTVWYLLFGPSPKPSPVQIGNYKIPGEIVEQLRKEYPITSARFILEDKRFMEIMIEEGYFTIDMIPEER